MSKIQHNAYTGVEKRDIHRDGQGQLHWWRQVIGGREASVCSSGRHRERQDWKRIVVVTKRPCLDRFGLGRQMWRL